MMTSQEYINRFRMNQSNYEFNRVEFINQLGKDFLESIRNHPEYQENLPSKLAYRHFKDLVKAYEIKFKEISDLKIGKPLSRNLWGKFFATVVVPYREIYYPNTQAYINKVRGVKGNWVVKSRYNKTGQNGKANY